MRVWWEKSYCYDFEDLNNSFKRMLNDFVIVLNDGYECWVCFFYWIFVVSMVIFVVSGYFIFMVYLRFYWGEVGNDLVFVLFELLISKNY